MKAGFRLSLLLYGVLAALAVLAVLGSAPARAAPHQLTARVDEALRVLSATQALDSALNPGWSLVFVNRTAKSVGLVFGDAAGAQHAVVLLPDDPGDGSTPGKRLWYRVNGTASPSERESLLRVARLVEDSLPDDAIIEEPPPPPPPTPAPILTPSEQIAAWARAHGTIPKWAALVLGALQPIVILGILLAAIARRPRRDKTLGTSATVGREEILLWIALFAVVAWALVRALGWSPSMWMDTFHDESFVRDCIRDGRCTVVGQGATVGIFHSAGFHHFRSFLQWLGLGPARQYRLILAANALGVVLAAVVARRLQGRTAAALTALLGIASIGVGTQTHVLSDVAPVPFFGALFLLTAVTAHESRGVGWMIAAGVVAGIAMDVYSSSVPFLLPLAWIAVRAPDRRLLRLVAGGLSAGLTALLIAPAGWVLDLSIVLAGHGGIPAREGPTTALWTIPTFRLARVAIVAFVVAITAAGPRSPLVRRIEIPAAIFLPVVLLVMIGAHRGLLDPSPKYLAHVVFAIAVTVSVSAAGLIDIVWRWVGTRVESYRDRIAWCGVLVERLAPWAVLAILGNAGMNRAAVGQLGRVIGPTVDDSSGAVLTYDDIVAVKRVLTEERGWSFASVWRDVKSPDSVFGPPMLRWVPEWPSTGRDDFLNRAYLFKLPTSKVPASLPPGTVVANESGSHSALISVGCSWIDWSDFEACVSRSGPGEGERCVRSSLPAEREVVRHHDDTDSAEWNVPGIPHGDEIVGRTLRLKLPLHPRAECPRTTIVIPHLLRGCHGVIDHIEGGQIDGGSVEGENSGKDARIDRDRSRAELSVGGADGSSPPRQLVVRWDVTPTCITDFRGFPPFFIEGDPRTVEFVASAIEGPR